MGGGGDTFDAVTFDLLDLTDSDGSDMTYTNANGVYTITNRSAASFDLAAQGTETAVTATMTITRDGIDQATLTSTP
jgi:hypothetical protein